ncbi:hypothetical protein HYW68_01170 [Candidatus Parcubacteria bacterium]|nr:hypothetical protein [Candidatus Parcubacteria bacterium]
MVAFLKTLFPRGAGKSAAGMVLLVALGVFVSGGSAFSFERLCQPIEFCVLDTADGEVRYTINFASLAANPLWRPGYVAPFFDPVPVIHRAFQAWQETRGHFLRFRYEPNAVFSAADSQPLLEVYFIPTNRTGIVVLTQRAGRTRYGQAQMGTDFGTVGISKRGFYRDLVHEIGHLLGLDHPKSFPPIGGPVMGYGGVPIGVEWFPLDPDDIAGIRFLYPVPREQSGGQLAVRPEIEIWPASGTVRYQGQDFQVAILHSQGRGQITFAQALVNGQDVTAGVGWLFSMFGRLIPSGYVLSVPPQPSVNLLPLLRLGLRCGTTLECAFFPPRTVGSPFTLTVISRDRAGNEARVERTYNIVP